MGGGWALRRAAALRQCDSCFDRIPAGEIYFLTMEGQKLCRDCPPEDEGSPLC